MLGLVWLTIRLALAACAVVVMRELADVLPFLVSLTLSHTHIFPYYSASYRRQHSY